MRKKPNGLKLPQILVPCTIDTISHTAFSFKHFSVEITEEQIPSTGLISQKLWVWSSFRLGCLSHGTVLDGTY